MAKQRSAEEIRRSIEANRADLAVALERLRVEVAVATDWRRQLREHHQQAVTAAAGAGFVLGGGIGALLNLIKR